jgi:membrane-bound lytic murein transglycosylase A
MKSFLLIFLGLTTLAYGQAVEVTPTVQVSQSLDFLDDMNFDNLDLAINRQLSSYDVQGLGGEIKFGAKVYPKRVLKESLLLLQSLAANTRNCLKSSSTDDCIKLLNQEINSKFTIYRPVPKKSESGYKSELTTKYTSYYSPDLTGSRVPTERFKHAIYRKPSEPELQNFSRVDIDYKGALAGKGYEIFWVEDSYFDLYLLHVQGGGRMNIINPDGSKDIKYLSYDGKNSRPFKMIYHYLIQSGYLKPENASIDNQRKFLKENPHKEEEVFGTCPSYVYFRESNEEPYGLDNIPLTEGRSLAMDSKIYRTTGIINFVKTKRASHLDENGRVVKIPFSRFFIGQDTGGAIKGNARCDLYFGYGPLAEMTAYNMNEMGEQYFLIKK